MSHKMNHFVKNVVTLFIIVLLLPYVITTIFHGGLEYQSTDQAQTPTTDEKMVSVKGTDGKVTKMPLEDYVTGVTAKEMPITYEKEALKAQSVIARTTIQKALEQNPNQIFDLSNGYLSPADMENYWGYEGFLKKEEALKTIDEETKGLVMRYQGACIEAAFHAVSSGKTRSGKEALQSDQYPYLESVECDSDLKADTYFQTVILDYKKVGELFGVANLVTLPEITQTDSASYALKVKVADQNVTGEEFRSKLNLPSSAMTITDFDGQIKIVTKGLGHGVGLSQYGANEMAKEGKTYQDILNYYYKNIEIKGE